MRCHRLQLTTDNAARPPPLDFAYGFDYNVLYFLYCMENGIYFAMDAGDIPQQRICLRYEGFND